VGLGPVFVLELEMKHHEEFLVVQESCIERLSKQDEENLQTTKKVKKSHKSKEDDSAGEEKIFSNMQIEKMISSKQQIISSNLITTNDQIGKIMTSTHDILERSMEQQQTGSREEG